MPTEETLTIEKLVYGGDGLARLESKVVFVPYVLPGEVVRAEVDRAKNDLWRGRLLEVLQPSPGRVTAPCPYFLRCGGCDYQHAPYERQLEWKREILRETLRRVGKIEFAGDIEVISGDPWQYRNRAQLHIDHGKAGYFERGSHRLCAIDYCPISSPALNRAIATLHAELPRMPAFTTTIELFTNEIEMQVNALDRVPPRARALFDSLGVSGPIEYAGFRVGRNSFFQVNRFLIGRLVDCAIGDARGDSAVDLYAGVGLFTAHLAERFGSVTAIESSRGAFRDLEHNLEGRASAENTTAEDCLARLDVAPDFVIADPPRAGLGKQVARELVRLRAPQLAIVSCDPATLARDLAKLLAGGYRIEKIALVDLFPQTFHIETVVRVQS